MKSLSLGSPQGLNRSLGIFSILAASVVALMVVGILGTHSSQEFFQSARSSSDYAAYISGNPWGSFGLRLNLGLDNLFMLTYGTFFVLLAARFRNILPSGVVTVAIVALMATMALDMLENQHIYQILHAIESHLPLDEGAGAFQMVESGLKFHISYLGILLFSFGYATQGRLGLVIAWITRLAYLPLGLIISVYPVEGVTPLVLARTAFFVVVFFLSGILFMRQAMGKDENDQKIS